jgi:hypothetical protein
MNILIVGDSFAADWSVKYKNVFGWPNRLDKIYNVTNLAQAGVSEYKIYKQLISVDLDLFDLVIITHTSPYRVVTKHHPIHCNDSLHKHSDLLFSDIEYHSNSFLGWLNRSLRSAYNFFIFHFDQEYQELVYELFVDRIEQVLHNKMTIAIVTPIALDRCIKQNNTIYIHNNQVQQGLTNHMSDSDNLELFQKICNCIDEIKQS